ncbi:MAG TPA: aminotransferase class I/II-fold pyridoxal phosphate-dependent enzyme [Phycisphaerales bacterium]|nr:aminotransferase class I/II-fold pyridoxal phosphate-dependent enzyme [Phycisphaerales bacterium]
MPAPPFDAATATTVTTTDGRSLVSFGGCNYHGLAHHPRVVRAAQDALARFGLSASASRETTGNARPHELLERETAGFLGSESALLVPDGYTANVAAAQAAARTHGVAILDERSHASLHDAAAAAGLHTLVHRHGDADQAAAMVAAHAEHGIVMMVDGVFAADGRIARLRELLAALPQDGLLIVDDCHGFLTLGQDGRGTASHLGLHDPRIALTTTLAKGLGCAGGIVAGQHCFIERARRATAYVCTTPTPPALAEAAREGLRVMRDEPWRLERLRDNASRLRAHAVRLGLAVCPDPTPIITFTLGTRDDMEHARATLTAAGFRVPLIDYPGGPAPTYFRLMVSSEHTPDQIDSLAAALAGAISRPIRAAS